jgi:hypothetical protein
VAASRAAAVSRGPTGWCTRKPRRARLAQQPNQPTSCVDSQPTGVLRAGAPHHRVAEHLVHQTAYCTTTAATHRPRRLAVSQPVRASGLDIFPMGHGVGFRSTYMPDLPSRGGGWTTLAHWISPVFL